MGMMDDLCKFGSLMFGTGSSALREDGVHVFNKIDSGVLRSSEAIKSTLVAIEVAVKMLQEPQSGDQLPKSLLYIKPGEIDFEIDVPLLYGSFKHFTTGPVLLWRNSIRDQRHIYFFFKFDKDFKLIYPIDKIYIDVTSLPFTKSLTIIRTEQKMLGELEEILHNM